MLTFTEEIYRGNYCFRIFGKEDMMTQVYEFLDKELENVKFEIKLTGVLKAINSNPLLYSHPEKFKLLEHNVWEIKIKQHRIACIWDAKPNNLIATYGFIKKTDKWPKRHLENMRNQKDGYLTTRCKRIEGDIHERNKKIKK